MMLNCAWYQTVNLQRFCSSFPVTSLKSHVTSRVWQFFNVLVFLIFERGTFAAYNLPLLSLIKQPLITCSDIQPVIISIHLSPRRPTIDLRVRMVKAGYLEVCTINREYFVSKILLAINFCVNKC